MILADGINLPIVLLLGLATIGPLTLLVVVVESFTFWGLYRVRLWASLKVILVANILSMVAGLVVYMFQDGILYAVGVRTPADFARHYLFGALVLIGLYFVVSVAVEGAYVARRRFVSLLGPPRTRLWQAVLVANVASYMLMGPVFYCSTRPTFHGLKFVDDPASLSKCEDAIYFVAASNGYLCRIHADGHGFAQVVPHEVRDFLVSADQTAFLYRAVDGNLWFLGQDDSRPRLVWRTEERFQMNEVDLSADKTRVAYASLSQVVVYDLLAERIVAQASLPGQEWHPVGVLGWDADDPAVLHLGTVWSGQQAWRLDAGSLVPTTALGSRLVGNFRRCTPGSSWGSRDDWGVPLSFVQQQGDLTLHSERGLGKHIRVEAWLFLSSRRRCRMAPPAHGNQVCATPCVNGGWHSPPAGVGVVCRPEGHGAPA